MKLSDHPQGPAIIAALAANGHPDAGETPIVHDRSAPPGLAYFVGGEAVFVSTAPVEIEGVYAWTIGPRPPIRYDVLIHEGPPAGFGEVIPVAPAFKAKAPDTFLIKICGVTSPEDAAAAVAAGADAIGVNFWERSRRFVGGIEAARRVLAGIPAGVLKVGVFVDASADEVERTMVATGLDRVQLHGDEDPADYRHFPAGAVIRAVRVRDKASLAAGAMWRAPLYLYDGFGGATAPWPLIADGATGPFLLAGGLTVENVAQAIALTRPDGVDVASGVESAVGVKDHAKMRAFIAAARAAAALFKAPADAAPRRGEAFLERLEAHERAQASGSGRETIEEYWRVMSADDVIGPGYRSRGGECGTRTKPHLISPASARFPDCALCGQRGSDARVEKRAGLVTIPPTPAGRMEWIAEMLNPSDGSAPCITKEQAALSEYTFVLLCPRCTFRLTCFYMDASIVAKHVAAHRLECPGGWKGYAAYTIRPARQAGRRVE